MIMGVSPAVALTVAVFFMSITRSEWIQLWSGGLGAIPASVVAALVAMWVLRRSNENQRDVAAAAAKEQDRLAGIQLEEQKRISAEQLAEQRSESAQVRRNEIMADLLGAANGFELAAEKGIEAVEVQFTHFATQARRWEIEVQDPISKLEFLAWAMVLWKPARYLAQLTDAPVESRKAWDRFLGEVTTVISSAGLVVTSASSSARMEFMDFLKARRQEFNVRWDEDLANMPGGTSRAAAASSLSRSEDKNPS